MTTRRVELQRRLARALIEAGQVLAELADLDAGTKPVAPKPTQPHRPDRRRGAQLLARAGVIVE